MAALHEHEGCLVHAVPAFNKAFLIAIISNGVFVIFQVFFAYSSHSTSLLADAFHNLGDVLSLVLAWLANGLLNKLPTARTTYGMKKTSILAALANGLLLVFTCGIIASEAMYKLLSPSAVGAISVMIVAGMGIVVNGVTAMLFMRGGDDLNIRAAFLHLVSDALVSVGVVCSAALLYWTGWLWLDPLVGLVIAAIILKGTWSLFADSFRLIIDGVPKKISVVNVQGLLERQPGVQGVHDLHVWALSTRENALSVHLWMPNDLLTDQARQALSDQLRKDHHIHHTTIQVERELGYCHDICSPYL